MIEPEINKINNALLSLEKRLVVVEETLGRYKEAMNYLLTCHMSNETRKKTLEIIDGKARFQI